MKRVRDIGKFRNIHLNGFIKTIGKDTLIFPIYRLKEVKRNKQVKIISCFI